MTLVLIDKKRKAKHRIIDVDMEIPMDEPIIFTQDRNGRFGFKKYEIISQKEIYNKLTFLRDKRWLPDILVRFIDWIRDSLWEYEEGE